LHSALILPVEDIKEIQNNTIHDNYVLAYIESVRQILTI
jgi:hypothetical protein